MALPMSVAPKKVQKGTRKWPHVIPARSNRGFGILARSNEFTIRTRRRRMRTRTRTRRTTRRTRTRRIYLAAASMPKKPTLSTSCWTAYLTLSNLARQSY